MTVSVDRAALNAQLVTLRESLRSRPEATYRALRPTLANWGADWERRMTSRFQNSPLKSRTGSLERSMKSKLSGSDLGSLSLRMESTGNLAYANIQEFGGEIRPKRGKYLTIPTEANKTAAGVTRFPSAREFIAANKADTFFLPYKSSSGPALLLMWKKGTAAVRKSAGAKKGEAVPMFRLVRKVDLPGPRSPSKRGPSRLGFYDSWNDGRIARAADLATLKVGP